MFRKQNPHVIQANNSNVNSVDENNFEVEVLTESIESCEDEHAGWQGCRTVSVSLRAFMVEI